MIVTRIPQTRTDPEEVITTADGFELVETLIGTIMDDGCDTIPGTIYLSDQNCDEHEVAVDWTTMREKEAVELVCAHWPEDEWSEARPVLEALLWQSPKWLAEDHDVEVV